MTWIHWTAFAVVKIIASNMAPTNFAPFNVSKFGLAFEWRTKKLIKINQKNLREKLTRQAEKGAENWSCNEPVVPHVQIITFETKVLFKLFLFVFAHFHKVFSLNSFFITSKYQRRTLSIISSWVFRFALSSRKFLRAWSISSSEYLSLWCSISATSFSRISYTSCAFSSFFRKSWTRVEY